MNKTTYLAAIVFCTISSTSFASDTDKFSQPDLRSEAHLKAQFGAAAVQIEAGVYQIRDGDQLRTFYFDEDGLRARMAEYESHVSALSARADLDQNPAARKLLLDLSAQVASMKTDLALAEKQQSKAETLVGSTCGHNYNLVTSSSHAGGALQADAWASGTQGLPYTDYKLYTNAFLMDNTLDIIFSSEDPQSDYSSGATVGSISSTTSGSVDSVTCRAAAGANYTGYNSSGGFCGYRSVNSYTVFQCYP